MWEFGATGKAFRNSGYPRGWAPQPKGLKTSVSAPGPSSLLGILLPHLAKQFTFFFSSFCSQQGSSEEDEGPCCDGKRPCVWWSSQGRAAQRWDHQETSVQVWPEGIPLGDELPCSAVPPCPGNPLTNNHMTGKLLAFPTIPVT